MPLDALRVNQQPLFGFDKVPATEQQSMLIGDLLRNRGVGAPTIGQGNYDAYSAPISTQNQFVDAQKKARDYQTNQNFISAAGSAINTGGEVADIMGLDEDGIARFLVENADLVTGLAGLSKAGIKKLAGSPTGRKIAKVIADKKAQIGQSLDNMASNFGPEYALADGYMPTSKLFADKATESGADASLTLGALGNAGTRQVGSMDDLGAFAMGDGNYQGSIDRVNDAKSLFGDDSKMPVTLARKNMRLTHNPTATKQLQILGQLIQNANDPFNPISKVPDIHAMDFTDLTRNINPEAFNNIDLGILNGVNRAELFNALNLALPTKIYQPKSLFGKVHFLDGFGDHNTIKHVGNSMVKDNTPVYNMAIDKGITGLSNRADLDLYNDDRVKSLFAGIKPEDFPFMAKELMKDKDLFSHGFSGGMFQNMVFPAGRKNPYNPWTEAILGYDNPAEFPNGWEVPLIKDSRPDDVIQEMVESTNPYVSWIGSKTPQLQREFGVDDFYKELTDANNYYTGDIGKLLHGYMLDDMGADLIRSPNSTNQHMVQLKDLFSK